MNGILAQTVALVTHARARQVDARLGGDEAYWRQHSTFRFVRALRFTTRRGRFFRVAEEEIARTPVGWMNTLPIDVDIGLVSLDGLAWTLAGESRKGIAVSGSGHSALWIPAWTVVAQYPEEKIWSVKYVAARGRHPSVEPTTIEEARERLAGGLREATEFASATAGLAVWCETFDGATRRLGARDPVAPYHPDMLPADGYSLSARQLLAASAAAFVFGSMGSWNDMGFADGDIQARYLRVTRDLYAAVLGGLMAAVNHGITSRDAA